MFWLLLFSFVFSFSKKYKQNSTGEFEFFNRFYFNTYSVLVSLPIINKSFEDWNKERLFCYFVVLLVCSKLKRCPSLVGKKTNLKLGQKSLDFRQFFLFCLQSGQSSDFRQLLWFLLSEIRTFCSVWAYFGSVFGR